MGAEIFAEPSARDVLGRAVEPSVESRLVREHAPAGHSVEADDLLDEVRSVKPIVFEALESPEIVSQLDRAGHAEVELQACQHFVRGLNLAEAIPHRLQPAKGGVLTWLSISGSSWAAARLCA
jgi:hypothetical protein